MVAMFDQLFEGATPLIARLAEGGPYRSPAAILERARAILSGLSEAEKIAVINAHPRIGEPPTKVKAQSQLSYREQGYDADTTPPEVFRELARLNAAYERRFGFRFVVFVNRRPKAAIVPVLTERLERTREAEMATALAEILAIAADRAQSLPADEPPQRRRP